MDSVSGKLFDLRWERSRADLLQPFRRLYGERPAIEQSLKDLLHKRWSERPQKLKDLDLERDLNPDWFLSEKMIGYVFYTDRFAGTLKGVLDHIEYLMSLGGGTFPVNGGKIAVAPYGRLWLG